MVNVMKYGKRFNIFPVRREGWVEIQHTEEVQLRLI